MTSAHLISIGAELIHGRTIDTNSAWLAAELAAIGIHTSRHITVGDDRDDIGRTIAASASVADVIIVTGGLGPTDDDLTRVALADALAAPLAERPELIERLVAFFKTRNRAMPESNRRQAQVPRGASPIENCWGTAPGLIARLGRAEIFCLPGVPYEMEAMFQHAVRTLLARRSGGGVIRESLVQTFGGGEAEIGERIADLMKRGRNPEIGTTAKDAVIGIRVVVSAASASDAERLMDADVAELRRRLGHWVFGLGATTLQRAVADALFTCGATVATAESCTGGLITKWLTDIPGSSRYFMAGYVTYSNEAKTRELDVPADLIAAHGAVSEPVAAAMARGCRERARTDYALAVTGVAGPDGGTDAKPIGLVYVALASADDVIVRELRLGSHLDREQIRDRSAKAAINLLRLALMPPAAAVEAPGL